ncbi:hypothetical protein MMC13_001087 [Lambiella insularis]|nr:hypothetical protein [Lambiella insularis]
MEGRNSSDILRTDPIGNGLSSDDSLVKQPQIDGNAPMIKTSIVEQPVTIQRQPYVPNEADSLVDAGVARATIAASKEMPNGTPGYAQKHQNMTVVQQHAEYWDLDHDGIIWPQDTYIGCRNFGWNVFLSLFATFIINFNLSYPTVPGYLPDPFFRIYLDKMYKDKHGSDSMTYDNEGRFRPQNFEDLFAKYDKGNKGGLDKQDVLRMMKGQRIVFDFFGMSATLLEWTATYLLLWPDDGVMKKEDIRGIYDGSIFYKKAEEHQRKQRVKAGMRSSTSPRLLQRARNAGSSLWDGVEKENSALTKEAKKLI